MPTEFDGEYMSESQFYPDESLAVLDTAIRGIIPSFAVAGDYLLNRFHADGVAREYINQGFLRRLTTMARCIEQIFSICPPDTCKLADPSVAIDIGIFLQSFYIHLYGAFENLARVSVEMSGAELSEGEKRTASFLSKRLSKKVKVTLPPPLLDYHSADKMSSWREHLNDFRHTLAHRIPLYIPPSSVRPEDEELYKELEIQKGKLLRESAEWVFGRSKSPENVFRDIEKVDDFHQKIAEVEQKQTDLEFFIPVATHSYTEGGIPIGFHGQIIANWNTILEFLCHFLEVMQPPLGEQLRADLIKTGIILGESEQNDNNGSVTPDAR